MDTLSYKEMAVEYPNIPSTTFRKWKSKGKLNPVEVVGASPRFARADIETCIKNYQPEKNSAPSRKRNAALRKATLFNAVDMPADDTPAAVKNSCQGSSEETAAPVDVTIESPSFKVEEMTLDARVERIRQLVKGIAYNVAQIGFELIEAKKQVRHGGWAQWLKENFQWTQQTAGNYMRIAERFGDGNLKNPFRFGRAVLLEMTKLPAGTEEKFIEAQAAAGKPVESMSAREAKKAVKQFKETQGEVKGVYVDVTLEGKNAATVEELNRDVELQSQAAVVEVPTANVESYAPMDKPDDTAAANADTDNPQKGKEIESRVKIFSRDVDAQLDDIRLLIEETTDAGDAKMIRVALKNLIESVNRITAGLDNKIEELQEAAMPSLLDG